MEAKLPIYGLAGLSNEQINAELHRKIKSGKQYDRFMPYSDCSSVKLAEGDTKVAIDNMAIWSNKYAHHTKDLSVLFASDNLQNTCEAIHTFLYHHFQYKIDGFKQNLRSPACSWVSRKEGIDCKSYSIFASTILTNLGIKHYFRRIKQDADSGFTHVYVIVPKNQENPADLSSGYFCIDGTLPFESEPLFYENDDVFVTNNQKGLGSASAVLAVADTVLKILAPFIQQAILTLLTENCTDDNLKQMALKIEKKLMPFIKSQLEKIQEGISYNNLSQIENGFNRLFFELDLGVAHLKRYEANDVSCLNEAVSQATTHILKIKDVVDAFFNNYIKTQKHISVKVEKHKALSNKRNIYFIAPLNYNPAIEEYRYITITSDKKEYGISTSFPYGRAGQTFEDVEKNWLYEVEKWIAEKNSPTQAKRFINEVRPYVAEIKKIREKLYFGAVGVFLMEQPTQRKINRLFLKYDKDLSKFILNQAEDLIKENEQTFERFKIQLQNDNEQLKQAKHRKLFKRVFSGISLFLVLVTIYKIRSRK